MPPKKRKKNPPKEEVPKTLKDIPGDVINGIAKFLNTEDIINARKSFKLFFETMRAEFFYRKYLHLINPPNISQVVPERQRDINYETVCTEVNGKIQDIAEQLIDKFYDFPLSWGKTGKNNFVTFMNNGIILLKELVGDSPELLVAGVYRAFKHCEEKRAYLTWDKKAEEFWSPERVDFLLTFLLYLLDTRSVEFIVKEDARLARIVEAREGMGAEPFLKELTTQFVQPEDIEKDIENFRIKYDEKLTQIYQTLLYASQLNNENQLLAFQADIGQRQEPYKNQEIYIPQIENYEVFEAQMLKMISILAEEMPIFNSGKGFEGPVEFVGAVWQPFWEAAKKISDPERIKQLHLDAIHNYIFKVFVNNPDPLIGMELLFGALECYYSLQKLEESTVDESIHNAAAAHKNDFINLIDLVKEHTTPQEVEEWLFHSGDPIESYALLAAKGLKDLVKDLQNFGFEISEPSSQFILH